MTTTDTSRAEAVAWLVGRLRFEQLLADLQRSAAAPADATTTASDDTVAGPAEVDAPVAA